MSAALELMAKMRAVRRAGAAPLRSLTEDQLATHVGPDRSDDVRAVLLRLASGDDRRCVVLADVFAVLGWRPTEAQRILAHLAHTRAQLRAALLGLSDGLLDAEPAPGEWSVRQALRHIVNNERRFALDAAYALERLRGGGSLPVERADEGRGPGTLGPDLPGTLGDVIGTLDAVREDVVGTTVGLNDDGLAAPTTWGGREVNIGFMLYRRAMHERQHLVQIRKTLQRIGFQRTEVLLLLGQAAIARGQLEGMLVGVPDEVLGREPSADLPSIEGLQTEAMTEEKSQLDAMLKATARGGSIREP